MTALANQGHFGIWLRWEAVRLKGVDKLAAASGVSASTLQDYFKSADPIQERKDVNNLQKLADALAGGDLQAFHEKWRASTRTAYPTARGAGATPLAPLTPIPFATDAERVKISNVSTRRELGEVLGQISREILKETK